MRTVLVTGSDTGIGKTRVVAALARMLAVGAIRVQIVKVVETGCAPGQAGDAAAARERAGCSTAGVYTLASFSTPLTPAAAARIDGGEVTLEKLLDELRRLPECDWRILEGAGGIATPVDAAGRDWADFAAAVKVDATVIVVPDRLGAINQARLAYGRAIQGGLHAGVWLNATAPVEPVVAASTREALATTRVPVWAEQACDAVQPVNPSEAIANISGERAPTESSSDDVGEGGPGLRSRPNGAERSPRPVSDDQTLEQRWRRILAEREGKKLRRTLRVSAARAGVLNLADNDYLELAHDPELAAAVTKSAREDGTSASASPLITGWQTCHERFLRALCAWHDFPCGLLWTSGYAANAAVLSGLPQRGDLVLADRLIHQSMIAGLLRSGARLQRYEHLRLDRLEEILERNASSARPTFVVTESVFSMDGDYPDLAKLAELKRRFGFFLVVDEAHALGWYGPAGAGQVRAAGISALVDGLIGTLGKALASGGAYTLFRSETVRDFVINHAGEFIYSTALSPLNVAAASAALERMRSLASEQASWQQRSRAFRAQLRDAGWDAPEGDSPIVPVRLKSPEAALPIAAALRERDILVAAVRPPTVPAGTSRLRLSLKRTFDDATAARVLAALSACKEVR